MNIVSSDDSAHLSAQLVALFMPLPGWWVGKQKAKVIFGGNMKFFG